MIVSTWRGRLIGKMKDNKVTVTEVAKHLGLTKSYVSMILRGYRTPLGAEAKLKAAVNAIIAGRADNDTGRDPKQ